MGTRKDRWGGGPGKTLLAFLGQPAMSGLNFHGGIVGPPPQKREDKHGTSAPAPLKYTKVQDYYTYATLANTSVNVENFAYFCSLSAAFCKLSEEEMGTQFWAIT